jgi:hypothetical protein
MSERVELNSDVRISSGVQGVKTSREPVSEEARKKFAQELERKLSHDKKKDKKQKEDEIIIHQEDTQDDEDNQKPEHKSQNSDINRGGLLDITA